MVVHGTKAKHIFVFIFKITKPPHCFVEKQIMGNLPIYSSFASSDNEFDQHCVIKVLKPFLEEEKFNN